jgi:DNA processing protein
MNLLDGWALMPLDPEYPEALHQLLEPPLVVYGIGQREALQRDRAVAVVGTRRPTPVARDLAHRIGTRLAEVGATVVSGLAVGVDGAVHQAVLQAGGETVAVVGGGLDAPGPVSHRRLAHAIVGRGAVISELAPGVRPTQGTFPRRNRIISALASATIVVEAPARSGALITARHALEQGRQLLVAPGRPLDGRVAGNLALLRESPAVPLVGLDEMIVDLGLAGSPPVTDPAQKRSPRLPVGTAMQMLGVQERAVAQALGHGPQTVDRLCTTTGLDPGVVSAALTILQLRGWARVLGDSQLPAGPLLDLHNS